MHTRHYSRQIQTWTHIYISVLAHSRTNAQFLLMRLPRQTFIDPVNLTPRAVHHSIYLCLIPIKPGLWTNSFSKPITPEGDKMQKQPLNNPFLHEISNQNKTQIYKSPGKRTWQHGCNTLLLTFVRFMCRKCRSA